jgi:phosphate starvation-inducible PhoH-like protein
VFFGLKSNNTPIAFRLEPEDNQRLVGLCGQYNTNLKQVEDRLRVSVSHRGNLFYVDGDPENASDAEKVLRALYESTKHDTELSAEAVHIAISQVPRDQIATDVNSDEVIVRVRKSTIRGRNQHQRSYLRDIRNHVLSFGVGPAGTGKTYLAVACAVEALSGSKFDRIILVRPAVEAGERLGFLPGDIGQKVDPYLRPLYDALYEMLGFDRVGRLLERGVIELAPLAYMRGRTLNEAFVILDEAQNTTVDQMKMFLTRIGYGSKVVVTGDPSQADLPRGTRSGLRHALQLLDNVDDIGVTRFQPGDVVRHPLVQRIVEAYDEETRGASERS